MENEISALELCEYIAISVSLNVLACLGRQIEKGL